MSVLPKENIYGHLNRVSWLKKFLRPQDEIMEFGCGTGYMITLPLKSEGYNVEGYDLDRASIDYGKKHIFNDYPPECIKAMDIRQINKQYDVIIASEVFEHIPNDELDEIIELIRSKLKPGGRLLVTVPNGYGWFECEKFFWTGLRMGSLLTKLRIARIIGDVKALIFGEYVAADYPSTLSSSPHVQRFTMKRIQQILIGHGFDILDATGSALFSGPFSNLLFTGITPVMRFSIYLGGIMPPIASGFYVAAKKIG